MASLSRMKNGTRRVQFVIDTVRRTIYLGRVSQKVAETIKIRVEYIVAAKASGTPLDAQTASWLGELDIAFTAKLVSAGLIDPPEQKKIPTLQEHIDRYIAVRGEAVKERTRSHWRQAQQSLVAYFGADRLLDSITSGDAKDYEVWLGTAAARKNSYAEKDKNTQGLAKNTIRKRCAEAKQFFAYAVDHELITRNPFRDIRGSVKGNPERQFFIDRPTTKKVIDGCGSCDWRTLIALNRFGGLRNPSETLQLRWVNIDWETSIMNVWDEKRNRYRQVPIFSELRPHLEESWEQAEPGQEYVITRWRYEDDPNLRTQFIKIIKRAGVTPWPNIFKNLRASRSTEVNREFGAFLESEWIGHTQAVAREHYLMVTPEDLDRATVCEPKATQNATQHTAATGRRGPHSWPTDAIKMSVLPGKATLCDPQQNRLVGREGLEPPTQRL